MCARWVLVLGSWIVSSGLVTVATSASARAEPSRFDYQAPETCPKPERFLQQIAVRLGGLAIAQPGQPSRRFSVLIEARRTDYEGTLEITERDGRSSHRSLQSADCTELMEALALVVALAIDPRASKGSAQGDTGSEGSAGQRPLTERASPDTSSGSELRDPREDSTPARSTSSQDARGVTLALGVAGGVLPGLAPAPLWGVGVFGEVTIDPTAQWAPLLRLSALRATRRQFIEQQGGAAFSWAGVTSEICGWAWSIGSSGSSWRPCLALEAGSSEAQGFDTLNPRDQKRGWFAAGIATEAALLLGPHLIVGGQLGGLVPLTRYDFLLGEATVHRVPDLAWRAALRVGIVLR